jgi:capsule biosynthesis phosphatase
MTERRALVIDIDGTLCPVKSQDARYEDLTPHVAMVERLRQWRADGYRIILHTSRNMRTYDGNLGLINKHTAPNLIGWLERWDIPFDELHFGKPWAGQDGFYIDDRAVRPDEFLKLGAGELRTLLNQAQLALEELTTENT